MHAAPASQQDSSVAPVSHPGAPPTGMPGISGGSGTPLDWALHAVAAASRQQQLQSHAAVPSLAPASAPAAQRAAPSSAAAARQSQQRAVPKPATEHQPCQQQLPASATASQQTAPQRRAEARMTSAVRQPQGEGCGSKALRMPIQSGETAHDRVIIFWALMKRMCASKLLLSAVIYGKNSPR